MGQGGDACLGYYHRNQCRPCFDGSALSRQARGNVSRMFWFLNFSCDPLIGRLHPTDLQRAQDRILMRTKAKAAPRLCDAKAISNHDQLAAIGQSNRWSERPDIKQKCSQKNCAGAEQLGSKRRNLLPRNHFVRNRRQEGKTEEEISKF